MITLHAEASALTVTAGLDDTMLVAGMANVASVQVTFSEDWTGLGKTLLFYNGDKTILHIMESDSEIVPIPHEVLAMPGRTLYVGVQGSDGERVILPTVRCKLKSVLASIDPDGDRETIPDKPHWEQVREDLQELAESAAETAQEIDEAAAAVHADRTAADTAAAAASGSAEAAAGDATAAAASAEAAAESARTLTIDDTLTKAGQAADSKTVGDQIGAEDIETTNTALYPRYKGILQESGVSDASTTNYSHITIAVPAAKYRKMLFVGNTERGAAFGLLSVASDGDEARGKPVTYAGDTGRYAVGANAVILADIPEDCIEIMVNVTTKPGSSVLSTYPQLLRLYPAGYTIYDELHTLEDDVVPDPTLTTPGKSADAATTGEYIGNLKKGIGNGVAYWDVNDKSHTQSAYVTNNYYKGTIDKSGSRITIRGGYSATSGIVQLIKLDSDSLIANAETAGLRDYTYHGSTTILTGTTQAAFDRTLALAPGNYRIRTEVRKLPARSEDDPTPLNVSGYVGLIGDAPDGGYKPVYAFERAGTVTVKWNHGGDLLAIGTTGYFAVEEQSNFALYLGIITNNVTFYSDYEADVTIERCDTPIINILAIGNSFTQDAWAYVPAVIRRILPDVQINFGNLYRSGTEIGAYAQHPDDTAWGDNADSVVYNEWACSDEAWTRNTKKYSLNDVLDMRNWDIVYGQVTCPTNGTNYTESGLQTAIADSKAMLDLIRAKCSRVKFVTGTWLSWGGPGQNGEPGAIAIAKFIRDCVAAGAFEDYTPVGAAIQDARTNPYIQRLGDIGNMRYNRTNAYGSGHMQNGTPTLIAAYTITAKLLEWLGRDYRGILGSDWVPTAENIVAAGCMTQTQMDNNGIGMTHGRPVFITAGDDKTADLHAAQEIAIRAVEKPDQVVPWDRGGYAESAFGLICDAYNSTIIYMAGDCCVYRGALYKCSGTTVTPYSPSETYGKDSLAEASGTIYRIIAPYDATKTYLQGEFCRNGGNICICTEDVTEAEAYDAAKWKTIEPYNAGTTYTEGDYCLDGADIKVYAYYDGQWNWVRRGGALDENATWYGILASAPFDYAKWNRTTIMAEIRSIAGAQA